MITFSQLGNHGRLGNQIFQYAFLYSLAAQKGYDFCIPPNTSLEQCFGLSCKIDTYRAENHMARCEPIEFDNNFPDTYKDNYDYAGYFQSEKYFYNIKDQLKNELKFKYKSASIRNYNNLVSIHIRRGDYINNKSHPVVTIDYINKAKTHFINKQFLVFSDDIDWCIKNNIGDFYSDNDGILKDYQDLYELSLCCSSIISNSTFGWWGAYLGIKKETVIAPKNWFSGDWSEAGYRDIYCDNWIIL
jgi:hypothetical protein